jgi:hypothetical protein
LFSWGTVAVAVLLTMAGVISPWGIVVLPLTVALVVKAHDLMTVRLRSLADGFARDNEEPPTPRVRGSSEPV